MHVDLKVKLDWQHLFGQFREGRPRLPELDRRHVAQRRVDPEVVVPVHVIRELGSELARPSSARRSGRQSPCCRSRRAGIRSSTVPNAHVGQVAAYMGARRPAAEAAHDDVRHVGLVDRPGVYLEPLPAVCAGQAVLPHDAADAAPADGNARPLERRLDLARSVPALSKAQCRAEVLSVGPECSMAVVFCPSSGELLLGAVDSPQAPPFRSLCSPYTPCTRR